jgi:hypothetical protein
MAWAVDGTIPEPNCDEVRRRDAGRSGPRDRPARRVVVGSALALFGVDVEPTASSVASAKIPPAMRALYELAAATCRGSPGDGIGS